MSRTEQTVWKSDDGERELLRLDRDTGLVTVPVCTLNLKELRELAQASAECAELASQPVLCEPANN